MKSLFFPCLLLLASCNTSVKREPSPSDTAIKAASNSDVDKSAYHATTDTVIIASKYFDTISYSKAEFNSIIDQYDYLIQEFPDPPNIAWAKDMAVALKNVKDNDPGFLSFSSEVGQDNYYSLYAYFLMQRDSSPALIQRRDKLNKICQGINDMAAELARGGTYYAHQYNRIPAFAEYAVNMFALDSVSFLKNGSFSKQKDLFIASVRLAANDQIVEDGDLVEASEKEHFKAKVFASIDDLEKQLADGFYLYYARQFYYNNY
ncbi:MAG TPA: hypothetical protein PKM63_03255 [Panacibacter sp.]|nr:hypothetical protein [Panacibacter sp.]HNP43276.1 hypothetical protein [Panacibacter sp.]